MQSHTADATDTDHNGAGLVQRLQEENQKLREALKAALSLTVKQQLGGSMGGSGSSPAAPHEQPAGGGVEGASEGSAIRASASPLVSKGARAQVDRVPREIRPTDVLEAVSEPRALLPLLRLRVVCPPHPLLAG